MWWMIGRSVLRSLPRGQAAPRVPAGTNRSGPPSVAGIVIFALLLPLMVAGVAVGYQGHASFGITSAFIVAFTVLLPVVCWAEYAVRRNQHRYRTPKLDYPPRQRALGAPEMRALAAQLRGQEAAEDAGERERRVTALFSVQCPVPSCLAPEKVPCAMGIGVPVALVRKDPVAFCHTERMGAAVRYGTATADDIFAQLDNNVPEEDA
jgi:hypothetical protein